MGLSCHSAISVYESPVGAFGFLSPLDGSHWISGGSPLVSRGIPWVPMGAHGLPKGCYGRPWVTVGAYGSFVGSHASLLGPHVLPWDPMNVRGTVLAFRRRA